MMKEAPTARVYVVGTADTKGEELAFLVAQIRAGGAETLLVDVGTRRPSISVDVSAEEVAASAGAVEALRANDRGEAVAAMAAALAKFLPARRDIDGVIGIGGGGGTSIVTAGMRALPLGLPKVMVTTLASGNTAPYVGLSDIVLVPAITDFAGLNRISRVVLSNAARAVVAMSASRPAPAADEKPALGLTMFGVTTPAVTMIADALKGAYEPLVFHATGTGGQTLEALVDSGLLFGVIDITTTEVADFLVGGVLPCLPSRLDCIARTRAPYIGSLGACDMVNFWGRDTVPAAFASRTFHQHNANVTLMRTSPEECRQIGEWIGRKLARCEGPVRFLIPEKGVSALDVEGGPFWDPFADAELFEGIARAADWTGERRLIRAPFHINDPAFAELAVAQFRDAMAAKK